MGSPLWIATQRDVLWLNDIERPSPMPLSLAPHGRHTFASPHAEDTQLGRESNAYRYIPFHCTDRLVRSAEQHVAAWPTGPTNASPHCPCVHLVHDSRNFFTNRWPRLGQPGRYGPRCPTLSVPPQRPCALFALQKMCRVPRPP